MTDQKTIALKVIETLQAQQNYFKIARSGIGTGKMEALEYSKKLERELKKMSEEIIKGEDVQKKLFE